MSADVLNIVSSLGFPIVACIAMAKYVKYITDKNSQEMKEIREQHNKEISNVTEALNNNTLALQHLADIMPQRKSGDK